MPLSWYNISITELRLHNLLPAGELPRGGIPRIHSKTGSREQKVQCKLQAPASSAAVSLSALPLPQAFPSNAFGSYSLIHFTKRSLLVSLHLVSSPALLQPHLLQLFLSSLPLPFEITRSYEGFGSKAQIYSWCCGSASQFSLILLPLLLCHAKHLGQRGCKMWLKIVFNLSWHIGLSIPTKAWGGGCVDLKVRIFYFKGI